MHWSDHAATIDFVEARLEGDLRLARVAGHLGYSPCYLHRGFRRALGVPLMTYVRRRRLTAAARALCASDEPVVDIALRFGFGSQQSFTTAFTAGYGMPPGAWRTRRSFYPLQLPYRFAEHEWKAPRIHHEVEVTGTVEVEELLGLSHAAVDMLPALRDDELVAAVRRPPASSKVLAVRHAGTAAGAMIIDSATAQVRYLAVHPLARESGTLATLMAVAGACHPGLTVTTFRHGDRADLGHRRALLDLGLRPGPLRVELGYPTQVLELATRVGRER